MELRIRRYRNQDENEWVKCHMLIDLEATAGELLKKKPKYSGRSVELVATMSDKMVGFLDIELETLPEQICFRKIEGNGMLWDLGVVREHRRQGIARKLLDEGIRRARKLGLQRLEAWTVEEDAKGFYKKYGFKEFYRYHHIRCDKREKLRAFDKNGLHVVSLYAHVMPDTNLHEVIENYEPKEVFTCVGFEINVSARRKKGKGLKSTVENGLLLDCFLNLCHHVWWKWRLHIVHFGGVFCNFLHEFFFSFCRCFEVAFHT